MKKRITDYAEYRDLIISLDEKTICSKLYIFLKKYQNKKKSVLLECLSKELNHKVNNDYVLKYSDLMKQRYNKSKGEEMILIYELSKALENNNEIKAMLLKTKIERIEDSKFKTKKDSKELLSTKEKKDNQKDNTVTDVVETMKKVVSGEEEAKSSVFRQKVKSYAGLIDSELYVDFFIKNNNLKAINYEEIDQLIETIEFFIKNIKETLEKLSKLNMYSEENKQAILNLYVSNQEIITNSNNGNLSNIYNWKLRRLKKLLETYSRYLDILKSIKEKKSVEDISKLQPKDKLLLKDEYDFLLDYYHDFNDLNTFKSTYIDSIANNLKNGGLKTSNELNKVYEKKLLK